MLSVTLFLVLSVFGSFLLAEVLYQVSDPDTQDESAVMKEGVVVLTRGGPRGKPTFTSENPAFVKWEDQTISLSDSNGNTIQIDELPPGDGAKKIPVSAVIWGKMSNGTFRQLPLDDAGRLYVRQLSDSVTASGNLTANGQSVMIDTFYHSDLTVQVTGCSAGDTILFETSLTQTVWHPIPLISLSDVSATSVSADGIYGVPKVRGRWVRARATSHDGGTVHVIMLTRSI